MTDVEDLGLFGETDLEDIPDDPWFVGSGTYLASVTKAERHTKKDGSGYALIISYTIDEPASDYHGQTKSDWFNLHLVDGRDYSDLDADEKKDVIRMKARLKRAFDKTEEEAKRVRPSELVGEKVYMKVVERQGKNEHAGKTFSNIDDVVSVRLWEEENKGRADSSVEESGLSY